MSEEEKNALRCLEWDMLDSKQIEIILNLIDKQQKEIEKLINEKNIYKELTKHAQDDVKIWKDLYYKKQKEIENLQGHTRVIGRVGGRTSE